MVVEVPSPGGFAGESVQSNLADTFNKRKDASGSTLDAFLNKEGRLAFRFLDAGGNSFAQPRVVGGGLESSIPQVTAPTLDLGLGSGTGSSNLVNRPGTSGAASGGAGQDSRAEAENVDATAQNISSSLGFAGAVLGGFPGMLSKGLNMAFGAEPTLANESLLTKALVALGAPDEMAPSRAVRSENRTKANQAMQDDTAAGDEGDPGTGARGQQSGPRGSGSGNVSSRGGLNGMSGNGSTGSAGAPGTGGRGQQSGPRGGGGGDGGDGGGGEGEGGGGGGCFAKGSLIEMKEGEPKTIESLEIGDITLGGRVTGIMIFDGDYDGYNYDGVITSGSHGVFEDGQWIRVRDSKIATKISEKIDRWYLHDTVSHEVISNGIRFTDFHETDATVGFQLVRAKTSLEFLNLKEQLKNKNAA